MNSNSSKPFGISSQKILSVVLFLDALTVTSAIALAVQREKSLFHYFAENTFVTYFSCFQLLIVAVLGWSIYRLGKRSPNRELVKNALFWLIVSLGVFYLALDDALSIHESLDRSIHGWLGIEETQISDLADDIIVGIYLILALAYVASQWKILQIFRSSFVYFRWGFVLGAIMVGFDILSNNNLFVSQVTDDPDLMDKAINYMGVVEETAKLVAEGLFLTGVYKCWRRARLLNSQHYSRSN